MAQPCVTTNDILRSNSDLLIRISNDEQLIDFLKVIDLSSDVSYFLFHVMKKIHGFHHTPSVWMSHEW